MVTVYVTDPDNTLVKAKVLETVDKFVKPVVYVDTNSMTTVSILQL